MASVVKYSILRLPNAAGGGNVAVGLLTTTTGVAPIKAVGDGPVVAVMTVSGWVGMSVGGTAVGEAVGVCVIVAVGRGVGKTGSASELQAVATNPKIIQSHTTGLFIHKRWL